MGNTVFIVGGARSGKSAYALELGSRIAGRKGFIATAETLDEEMRERIALHKKNRSREWETIEEPLALGGILKEIDGSYDVVIVDCLTLWLSNILGRDENSDRIIREIEYLATTLKTTSYKVIAVSNEVGQGIVPANNLARLFRDMSGLMNRKVAGVADEVYLITCGIPLKIK
ncbi:MAG: bifunctional adenosylcobinamide kinase/adenosylcobinamide-phosphate guanylyltransferase [Nitrospirae bacterium]|nr:bifunctional adenosylcobinamide kinase/adenosylcobinamide-phosphate guanylyltransferase [Nitrospirota bacterium]